MIVTFKGVVIPLLESLELLKSGLSTQCLFSGCQNLRKEFSRLLQVPFIEKLDQVIEKLQKQFQSYMDQGKEHPFISFSKS